MAALALGYVLLFGYRAVVLISGNEPVGIAIGILMLLFPAVAIWSIWSELKFGIAAENLARQLVADGFPALDLELRPSGKATKESATKAFESAKELAQVHEADWRHWYRLGEAYEAAGDRKRARAAIRQAIKLFSDNPKPL